MKIILENGKKFLKITKQEWEKIGLKFEEAKKKSQKGKNKKFGPKFERCVKHVKEKAEKVDGEWDPNPWAVCHTSVGKKKRRQREN